MEIKHLKKLLAILVIGIAVTITSCKKNLSPIGQQTSATVYKDFNNYKPILAKLYTAFALSGQQGPAGNPDVVGIDEGFSNYLRELFNMEELPTMTAQYMICTIWSGIRKMNL